MQLGMVGLGRMGSNLTRRLMRNGHEVVAYDVNADSVKQLESEGAIGTGSLEDFVNELSKPRAAWVMVPAAFAEQTTDELAELMEADDIVIDGGNSYYRDDMARAERYGTKGVHFVDVGTSGGVFGLERGFCLMIGGENEVVKHLDPIFSALAPGVDVAHRTPGRTDANATTAEQGYLHCGPVGAGHFVKMVHNGIEYALMAAYAEGLDVIRNAGVGVKSREIDAETAPLREPHYYPYDSIDLADVAEVWRRGSVIGSWLLDHTILDTLQRRVHLVAGDYADPATFERLAAAVREQAGQTPFAVHYLAVPPSLFGTVADGLAAVGPAERARL